MDKETFIAIWGSYAELGRAIGQGESTVRHWFSRGSVPAKHDADLIAAASARGHYIGPQQLYDLRQSLAKAAA
jgi:hypothetical protein